MNTRTLLYISFIAALLFISVLSLNAQDNQVFALKADDLQNGKAIELDKAGWKYHAGNDESWANPNLDDSGWETLADSALPIEKLSQTNWNGIGWFRLRVHIAPDAANEQLVLIMQHWGASEIYLDGRLIYRFGMVGASPETEQAFNPNGVPVGISFSTSGTHLIAVRHSATVFQNPTSAWTRWLAKQEEQYGTGFKLSIAPSPSFLEHNSALLLDTGNRFFRAGLILAIGFLFLLLFFFYPRRRATLFFGIFALSLSVNILSTFLLNASHFDLTILVFADLGGVLGWISSNLFLPVFLYSTFSVRIPRYYWIAAAMGLTTILIFILFPEWNLGVVLQGVTIGFLAIEVLRVMASALWQKKDGAWIIGLGTLFYLPLIFYLSLSNLGIITLPPAILFVFRQTGVVSIVVAISIYLSRQFARTSTNLEMQLVKEVEHEKEKARLLIVEAENERRAKELEEARQLQLSMLPKKLPQIEGLEIAAYMKPATEVGGDYYDFHVGEDGTLTVAVGDATGHGLKAGTMVTAAKTLFRNYADEKDIPHIFQKSSRVIKEMHLRGLFMAMTMLKIKGYELQVCAAGMPSTLVYRAETKQVEEISIKAMPLGSVSNFPYKQEEFTLSAGDCVVVMSDGFPEMFNESGEMLGFDKAGELLPEITDYPAKEIINHLVKIGDEWAGKRPLDDDVTFMVLKMV